MKKQHLKDAIRHAVGTSMIVAGIALLTYSVYDFSQNIQQVRGK